MKPPPIKVEVIHIDGPLKGTIQELYESVITVGRHPDCHVVFPREMNTISRHHLELHREGNRFKAVDRSTNGTLVNGKPIEHCYLKDGDVLTLGENGAKISILTSIIKEDELPMGQRSPAVKAPSPESRQQPKQEPGPAAAEAPKAAPEPAAVNHIADPQPPPTTENRPEPSKNREIGTAHQPFVIQFGVMIKSYKTLPITLGSGDDCDFFIAHRAIHNHHARIFFTGQQYRIKDLTGRGMVSINGAAVNDGAPLFPDARVSLSSQGPVFQFIGAGRLVEIEASVANAEFPGGSGTTATNGSEAKKKRFWSFGKK